MRTAGVERQKSSRKHLLVKPININYVIRDGQDKIKKT